MANFKKFIIIFALTLFMIHAVSASEAYETVSLNNNEVIVEEVCTEEIPEVYRKEDSLLSIEETESTIDNTDITMDNNPCCPEYNNYNTINYNEEKSFNIEFFEVKYCENQYNKSYIDYIMNDALGIDSDFGLNETTGSSVYIFNDFVTEYEVFNCIKLDESFEFRDFSRSFRLYEFKEFNILTHDILKFYNKYCHVLTHIVNEDIILGNDKLNSKFAYCIDNSIVGNANNLSNKILDSNFKILNYTFLSFPASEYFFKNLDLNSCVYNFFSVFNNRINEVFS